MSSPVRNVAAQPVDRAAAVDAAEASHRELIEQLVRARSAAAQTSREVAQTALEHAAAQEAFDASSTEANEAALTSAKRMHESTLRRNGRSEAALSAAREECDTGRLLALAAKRSVVQGQLATAITEFGATAAEFVEGFERVLLIVRKRKLALRKCNELTLTVAELRSQETGEPNPMCASPLVFEQPLFVGAESLCIELGRAARTFVFASTMTDIDARLAQKYGLP